MAAPIAEIDRRSLRRLEANLSRLGTKVVPRASKTAARAASRQAQLLLAVAFPRHIEGGPMPPSRVIPGSPSSSVLVVEKPTRGDEVSINLAVSRRAARWLQFQLGDRKRRRPGGVGVAKRANWAPQQARQKRLGFRLPFGNLAQGTLSRLVNMAESSRSEAVGGVFYRKPSRRSSGGSFRRKGRNSAPQLQVAEARQSRYKGNLRLQAAWTASVERAGGRMSADAARLMLREVEKLSKGGGAAAK